MPRYPDAYLNHWSDVYVARGLRAQGVGLEQFLASPVATLLRVDRTTDLLLGSSARRRHAAFDPLEADDPATVVRGGRLIEKLRHGKQSQRPTPWAQRLAHKLRRVLT